jgi:transcriptional regulator with XRE-family HTH domain
MVEGTMAKSQTPLDGALQLKRLVGPTQQDIADKLGTSKQNVQNWVTGAARPNAFMRDLIQRVLGIPRDAWLTKAERERLRGAA